MCDGGGVLLRSNTDFSRRAQKGLLSCLSSTRSSPSFLTPSTLLSCMLASPFSPHPLCVLLLYQFFLFLLIPLICVFPLTCLPY